MFIADPSQSPVLKPNAHAAIGRVVGVSGAQVSVELDATPNVFDAAQATVGKFVGIVSGRACIVGMVTEVAERREGERSGTSIARLDLVGEISVGAAGSNFRRGVTEYPLIGEPAKLITDRELRLIYTGAAGGWSRIGVLQQDNSIPAQVEIDSLVSKHFAILGTTGVGKSTAVAVILQRILQQRPDMRIFLIDPHNEYGRCFGESAQVMTPRNLRLPFWLFNFEETIDAFFGGRPGIDEEVEILTETIPLAKAMYVQYRPTGDRPYAKKRDPRDIGYGVDTPVPYRIEDLVALIDERMGKLENRSSRMVYYKLIQRIQTFRNHPRYGFMFENATVGGDTMVEVLSHLFRLPPNGTPMTIMQLAGFPAEVIDSVMSVLCRMAFDFGLWSDGASPLLFVCEEAHRYAPADKAIGFGPTRRALSRIAKEGRKYGVFLGLVTQRPAEIDPTIISQCSTLFVMRLSNERDQTLIRWAVSDAAANLLTFVPSLGTGEVFAFGAGVPLPMRMKFQELPPSQRPVSEAAATLDAAAGRVADTDWVSAAVDRWRVSTMSHKAALDDDGQAFGGSLARERGAQRAEAPTLQPAHTTIPNPAFGSDSARSRLLRRPLDAGEPGPVSPAPSAWRR